VYPHLRRFETVEGGGLLAIPITPLARLLSVAAPVAAMSVSGSFVGGLFRS